MSAATLVWCVLAGLRGSVLLALAGAAAGALRRGSAAARHHVWALGVAGALVEPVFAFVLPGWLPAEAAAPVAPAAGLVSLHVESASLAEGPGPWPAVVAALWVAGSAVVALRYVRAHLAAAWVWRQATPVTERRLQLAADAAAATLGLPPAAAARLRQRPGIASPVAVGIVDPGVLVPDDAATWPEPTLRAVLLHELAHVQRRDALVQAAAQLLRVVWWWNPLAWWAAARLRIEREQACDDVVVAAGVRPSSYAALLLGFARSARVAPPLGLAMAAGATEARLRRILAAGTVRIAPGLRFRAGAAVASGALAVGLGCSASPPPPGLAPSTDDSALEAPGPEASPTSSVAAAGPARPGRALLGELVPLPYFPADERPPEALMPAQRTASSVTTELQPRLAELERCYQARLAQRPGLAGDVVIHWTILADGTPLESCISSDTLGDPGVTECVNALTRGFWFSPAPGDSVSFDFPFTFSAGT